MKTVPASEYALMGTLMNGPIHGYEILRSLRDGLGTTWRIPTSQLYAQLKRMEEKGLVRSKIEPQDDRPSRRVFQLTDLGRKTFKEWALSPTEHVRNLRIEFLAKIYFIKNLSLDGPTLIKAQTDALERAVTRIKETIKNIEDPYENLSAEFKLATAQAWLNWLKKKARPFVEAL
jgi:DNA-binding PadR family transcriptional regulator